jgi:excisionase family DNA binding protein
MRVNVASVGDSEVTSYLARRFADLPETLTVRQLAQALGKDPKTIYRYLNAKPQELPGYPVGDRWVIYRDEVVEFLEKRWQERLATGSGDADELVDEG